MSKGNGPIKPPLGGLTDEFRRGLKWNTNYYWDSASYNAQTYDMIRGEAISMALTRYHWVNLPPTCDERFLELTLLYQGVATIATPLNKPDDWRSLQCVFQSGTRTAYDMYGNPVLWKAFGWNGAEFAASKANGIFVWDNKRRMPVMPRIDILCRELVDILKTMQQNRGHQKLPVIITGPQEKDFDRTQMVKQIEGGELFIIGNDSLNKSFQAETLDTQVPYIGNELWATYMNVWNSLYEALGIKNLPFKAERRIEDEVESQSDPTNLIALDGLSERRAACKYLNETFDYFKEKPLDVVWRSDTETANYDLAHDVTKLLNTVDGDGDDTNADRL